MTFNEYQLESKKTALYPNLVDKPLPYLALGVAGEAGEIADKVKKLLRDQQGMISDEWKQDFLKECGDVLWYLAQIATELGVDFDEVPRLNLIKTQDRQRRNTLTGSGDHR